MSTIGEVIVEIKGNLAPLDAALAAAKANSSTFADVADRNLGQVSAGLSSVSSRAGAAAADLRKLGSDAERAGAQTSKAFRGAANDARNLGFQLNDIFVGLTSGQSPLTVATQQGLQISQVLTGAGGLRATMTGLGAAAASAFNPVAIGLVGIGLASQVALDYFNSASDGAEKTKRLFKEHEQGIEAIRKAWGDAALGAKAYADESAAVLASDAQTRLQDIKKKIAEGAAAISSEIAKVRVDQSQVEGGSIIDNGAAEAFKKPFEDFLATIRAGRPDIVGLRDAIAQIMLANPNDKRIQDVGTAIKGLSAESSQAQRAIPGASRELEVLGQSAKGALPFLLATNSALGDLLKIPSIGQKVAETDKATDALKRYVEQQKAGEGSPLEQAITRENQEYARLTETLNAAVDSQQKLTEASATHQKRLAQIRAQYGDDGKKLSSGLSPFERAEDSGEKRVRDAQSEIATFGLARGAVTAYRLEQDLLAAAREKNANLSASEEARLRGLAAQYGALTDQLSRMRLLQDAQNDRDSVFMSDAEAGYRSKVRGGGLDPDSAEGQRIAGILRVTDALKDMKDVSHDAFTGFFDDIGRGLKPLDALKNSIKGVGASFAKQGAETLFNGVWGSITSSIPGLKDIGIGGKPDGSQARPYFVVSGSGGASGLLGSLGGDLLKGPGNVVKAPLAALNDNNMGAGLATALKTSGTANVTGLNSVFKDRLAQMFAAAPPDVAKGLSVYSGYRDVAHQARLYAASGGSGMVAPPGRSMHGFGEAADLRFGSDSARDWVHQNASSYGLRFPMDNPAKHPYEPWHIEPIGGRRQGGTLANSPQLADATKNLTDFNTKVADSTGSLGTFGQGLGSFGQALGGAGAGGAAGGGGDVFGGLLSGGLGILGKVFGFDTGGYTGDGSRKQPAGVVHRGEVVWSQSDVAAVGGPGVADSIRRDPTSLRPKIAKGGNSQMNYRGGDTTINVSGNADQNTVGQIKKMLDDRDRQRRYEDENKWRAA